MPQDIVILNIGSVQEYISTARRTLDLAIGSRLISLLALSAIQYAERQGEVEILIPQKLNGQWPRGVPNRLVLLAPENQGASLAEGMLKTIEQKREKISTQVKDIFDHAVGNGAYSDRRWQQQVSEWLDIYWVTAAWDGKEETFSKAFRTTSMGLDARKNLRNLSSALRKSDRDFLALS